MAIVAMRRLHLIGLRTEREALLSQLLHLGCVEVTETGTKLADPRWSALLRRDATGLTEVKSRVNGLQSALETLGRYAPAKSGPFFRRDKMAERTFLDAAAGQSALDTAEQINSRGRQIGRCQTQESRLVAQRAGLLPWAALEIPLEIAQTRFARLTYLTFPAAVHPEEITDALEKAAPMAALFPAGRDRELQYFLLICHKEEQGRAMDALRPFAAGVVPRKDVTGTAGENIAAIDRELSALSEEKKALEQEIAGYASERGALQVSLDRQNQELAKAAAEERMLTDGTVVFLEGWAPEPAVEGLKKALEEFTCAYELVQPEEGETPPILLKNPRWMECMNLVTEMYSLPAYHGIDPNPLIFFFFIFFFGFMFADVAYGLIIFAVSLAVTKRYRPKKTMGYLFRLGQYLGISTAVCGFFVGGFFGNLPEVIYDTFLQRDMPGWLRTFCDGLVVNPVGDPLKVLIIALCIGVVHLIFGQLVHIYMGFRDGEGVDGLLDVIPWWIVFAGLGALALGGGAAVLIVGALSLILTQGRHKKGFFGKLLGGVASLYGATGWLSDVLSYARLMALMLATSVIAQVFNTLGSLGGRSVFGIVLFIVVFLVGHGFNIGVNLIGTYVHAARLQYLEFFGKFYREGGVPFRPLQYDTKYVDIMEEEK